MIVEGFLSVLAGIFQGMLAALPTVPVPGWVSSAADSIGGVVNTAAGLSYWVPFPVFGGVVAAVLLAMGFGLALKVGRIVLSFFTAGGGSAG